MEELIIRPAAPADAEALLSIYRHYVLNTAITFEYDVPSAAEFRSRVEHTLEKYPYLVAQRGENILGYAYASALRTRAAYGWCVELSVYVDRQHKGEGIGRKLYEALEEALGEMGVTNLYACIAYPEQEDEFLTCDSVRFHERMGFVQNGLFRLCGYKFERWYHMVWMEKLIGSHQAHQPPVQPFKG